MSVTTTLETATVTTQLGADGVSTTVDGSTVEVTTGGGEVVVTALQGAAGVPGPPGPQGATGPQGPQGEPGVSGASTWGSITGTLSSQTDLQAALNAKANTTHSHVIADVTGLQTAIDSKANLGTDNTFSGNQTINGEFTLTSSRVTGTTPHVLFNVSKNSGQAAVFAFRRPSNTTQSLIAFETTNAANPDGYFGTVPSIEDRIYFAAGLGSGGSFAIDNTLGLLVGTGITSNFSTARISNTGDFIGVTSALTQSLTGAGTASILSLAPTWNTTGAPTAINLNVTDTASNANSSLIDLRVGGVSRFDVLKSGNVGIGTSIPSSSLQVVGNAAINGGAMIGTSPDLITNGSFATDTVWTKGTGWTISGGVASSANATGFGDIQQSIPSLVEGQAYELTVTVSVTSGGVAAFLGSSGNAQASFGNPITASGTYALTVVCPVGQPKVLLLRANNGFTGTIDNVSLRATATAGRLQTVGDVSATGTVTGSNLSGTNTGDETGAGILTKLAGVSGGGTTNFLRADGTFAAPPAGGGGGTWGSITGTLSNQTDLQAALNAKANTSHTHAIADVTGLQTALDGKLNLTGGSISGDIDLGYGNSVGLLASSDRGTFGGASYANYGLTFGFVATGDTDPTTALAGFGGVRLLTGGAPRLAITSSGTVAIASSTLTVGGRNVLNDIDGKQPIATVLTNTTASFTTAQETKLAGIATGATANATDAQLRDRATHTGSQAISTVTGLQTALDGKQAAGTYATGTGSASGTNTGDETYSSITSKLAAGSGGGTTNFLRADGTFAAPPAGGGSVSWGDITGTLSSQTDLQTALNGKANTTHTHVIADVTGLQTALDAKAPTASPTLTGTVTAGTVTSPAGTAFTINGTTGVTLTLGSGQLYIPARATGNTGMFIECAAGGNNYIDMSQGGTYRGGLAFNNTTGLGVYSTGAVRLNAATGNTSNLTVNNSTILSASGTGVSVTGTLSSTGTVTAPNIATNLSVFCSGKPDANEVIGGAIMPVAFTVTQGNCVAKATVAATASTVFTILKDGVTVGTCTFAAAATTGTFSITAGAITANQNLYVQAPATPDATLANISILLRA